MNEEAFNAAFDAAPNFGDMMREKLAAGTTAASLALPTPDFIDAQKPFTPPVNLTGPNGYISTDTLRQLMVQQAR